MATEHDLLQHWLKRARENILAHYAAAEIYAAYNLYMGIPATISAAIVGTAVFSSLESDNTISAQYKIAIGGMSIITVILAALQTFLRFSERSESHRMAGIRYSAVRRQIEKLMTVPNLIDPESLAKVEADLNIAAENSPNVSRKIFEKVLASAGQEYFLSNQSSTAYSKDP